MDELTKCPRCKQKFVCSPSGKCWCFEVHVPTDVQEKISDEYDGCLCPKCLKEMAG